MSYDITLKSSQVETKVCYYCNNEYEYQEEIFTRNYTSNMGYMGWEADAYAREKLKLPERQKSEHWLDFIEHKKAKDTLEWWYYVIEYVTSEERQESFKVREPENGWGSTKGFVRFLLSCYSAAQDNPEAIFYVSY